MQANTTQSPINTTQSAHDKPSIIGTGFPDIFAKGETADADDKASSQIEIDVPEIEPIPSTAPVYTPRSEDQLTTEFKKDVAGIKAHADGVIAATNKFESNRANAAIKVLAKIHGIYKKYFVGATEGQIVFLMAELRQITKLNSNKNTTAGHLLSRFYRGADRKKASSDAKVLTAAAEYKVYEVTEDNFETWLLSMGGYDAVVKNRTSAGQAGTSAKSERLPVLKSDAARKSAFQKSKQIAVQLADSGQLEKVFSVSVDSSPELVKALKPGSTKGFNLIVVQMVGNELYFGKLRDYLVSPIPVAGSEIDDGDADSQGDEADDVSGDVSDAAA